MLYRTLALILSVSLVLAACGDDDTDATNNTSNNGASADAGPDAESGDAAEDAGDEDVATIGDVSGGGDFDHRCGDALVTDWPLHEAVSTESVSATTADGVTTLEVEAAAGGSQQSSGNPFIYVDLEAGEKVELNDIEAHASTDWDLAFKRVVIRSNSADSGAGDVSIAKLTDTTFADVTEAPSNDDAWEQDVSYDEDCEPLLDPIGTLKTAVNHLNTFANSQSWYEYPGLNPAEGEIYVIDVPSRSTTYKMKIVSWNDGVYTLEIAEL
jgi:hypothetical protein